jgi:hypothetical protein
MSTSKFSDPFMMKSPVTPLQDNAFIKAKMDAEAAGKSSFSVDGKNYPLKMEEESPLASHHPTGIEPVDLGVVKSNYKGKERKLPFPGKEIYEGTGDYAKYKGKYSPEMLAMNKTYTQKWNEANIPGYTEMKRKQLEMENQMTKEEKSRDD